MPLGYGYFNVTTPKTNREKIDIKLEERCATIRPDSVYACQINWTVVYNDGDESSSESRHGLGNSS